MLSEPLQNPFDQETLTLIVRAVTSVAPDETLARAVCRGTGRQLQFALKRIPRVAERIHDMWECESYEDRVAMTRECFILGWIACLLYQDPAATSMLRQEMSEIDAKEKA
jgi:hypothetical protein